MASFSVSFAANVDAWSRENKQRLEAIFKTAVQDTIEIMQTTVANGGNMPVDTGFLRSSMQVIINGSFPPLVDEPRGGSARYNPNVATATLASAKLGDVVIVAYTARYAGYMEYGTSPHLIMPKNGKVLSFMRGGRRVFYKKVNHPGTKPLAFVRSAVAQWNVTVGRAILKAKAASEGR